MVDLSAESRRHKWEGSKSTFGRNMGLPVHGWFRFPAGFSAEWVTSVVLNNKNKMGSHALLDPFAGVGTAVLSGEEGGVKSYGIEAQPFIARVSQAKLLWRSNLQDFSAMGQAVLTLAQADTSFVPEYPPLIQKCYATETIRDLHRLFSAWRQLDDDEPAAKLTWLAIMSILRVCSSAGTAPWQYVLPRKSKAKVLPPYEAFGLQLHRMVTDMMVCQQLGDLPQGEIIQQDARSCTAINDDSIGLVITSPPYANNYDYADATRLEMTFLGEVSGWGDLHQSARKVLIRSCSQHVSIEKTPIGPLLDHLANSSFHSEISRVCEQLYEERSNHGGKKDYHSMVAAYFADMKDVWLSLRRVCVNGAEACFVIGDSAPYGVHVPVERWLGELALLAGFKSYSFEKIRDRNVKWKNRKHRVPLQEGFLWVQG